ncbi:hypothetical protein [Chloroflexus sp.]|uniref:hypothetical protein n=1 Tax=Chloroflexus sp. TaxID=1904827 RepID=UPI0026250E38|nr:hypothetical protein [uncultured Chloroflexus sp.]
MATILHPKTLIAAVLALALAAAAYGFAATNSFGSAVVVAGDGSLTISGYTVGSLTYVYDAADPTMIDKVTFTLTGAAAPTTVLVQLDGSNWVTATESGGTWTADPTPNVAIASHTTLRIVAHN